MIGYYFEDLVVHAPDHSTRKLYVLFVLTLIFLKGESPAISATVFSDLPSWPFLTDPLSELLWSRVFSFCHGTVGLLHVTLCSSG